LAYHPQESLPIAVDGDLEAATPQAASSAENFENASTISTKDILISNIDAETSSSGAPEHAGIGHAVDVSSAAQLETRPTFFGVARRILQLEGKGGLYKGIIPTLIVSFVTTVFSMNHLSRLYISPSPSTLGQTLVQSLFNTLFYSFALVWVYRSITVRTKLEIFGTSIKDAIGALFNYNERARPYNTITPALLSALLGQILLEFFVFQPLRNLIKPDQQAQPVDAIYFWRLGATGLVLLADTMISAPLNVITTRLAAQRSYGGPIILAEEQPAIISQVVEEKALDQDSEVQPSAESVAVRYRGDGLEPYTSVYDCATKIVEEEGWGVLYRGWFVIFLGKFYS
ncbi:hypothetical protein H0H87_010984, partial [Tephrocybe sp. NHM501043]